MALLPIAPTLDFDVLKILKPTPIKFVQIVHNPLGCSFSFEKGWRGGDPDEEAKKKETEKQSSEEAKNVKEDAEKTCRQKPRFWKKVVR